MTNERSVERFKLQTQNEAELAAMVGGDPLAGSGFETEQQDPDQSGSQSEKED